MENHSITTTTKALMLGVALLFDSTQFALNFIPVLGQILAILLGFFAQLTFWLWFNMKGVNYNSTKRLAAFATGFIVGLIPLLDALPELTLEVTLLLGTLTAEEKLSKLPMGAAAVGMAQQAAQSHPETKNLKENFRNLKSDRAGIVQKRDNIKKAA